MTNGTPENPQESVDLRDARDRVIGRSETKKIDEIRRNRAESSGIGDGVQCIAAGSSSVAGNTAARDGVCFFGEKVCRIEEGGMGIVARNEGGKINSNINVAPMVDVMLVLLIIFMVVTPLLRPGPPVEMVRAENPVQMPDADKEDTLLVAINREGQVFFGNEEITTDGVAQKIKDRIANRADKKVFVKADARSRYGVVVEVVDSVRSAGVDDLGLLTEQKRQ